MRNQNSQSSTPSKAVFIRSRKEREEAKYQKEFRQYHVNFARGYILSLIDDTHNTLRKLYGMADYTRDRQYISRRLENEDFTFVTHVLPGLMTGILNLLEHGDTSFPHFKIQYGTNYPSFLKRMFDIVTDDANYKAEDQAAALELIYNISVAFKKLRGRPNMDTHQKQYDEFVTTDKLLGEINFDSPELEPIMASLATQWYEFAHDLTIDDAECVPRPGPGAVVGNVPKHARYAPSVLFSQLESVFPLHEWFYSHIWDTCEESRNYIRLVNEAVPNPHSEWLLVPKTFLKWRGICKEANEVQFIQQAIRRQLYARIEKKLSKGIPIRDQEVHRILALNASIDRENATIDESEASDRIARLLISGMTSLTPEYRNALMACSTRFIKPPCWAKTSDLLSTHKFAPMGSAVCFPIMSLVHYFLVKAIILIYSKDRSIKVLQDLCSRVSVYGDDIVLPSSTVPLVYEWLPKFGIKINTNKSYAKSFFRESCGMHAYKGCDITPVYIKYTNFSSIDVSEAKQLASLIAAEELLAFKGKEKTAAFLREHIEAKWPNMPYVSNVTPLVGYRRPPFSSDLTDFSLLSKKTTSRKWDRWHQSFKYRLRIWDAPSESGIIPTEHEAYLRYKCLGPRRDVNISWTARGLKTSFRLDEFVRRMDDKAMTLNMKWSPMFSSALVGHNLKVDLIGCTA